MRLQVAISRAGIASRRKAAEMIESGRVSVNGRIVREKGYAVDPARDEIAAGGIKIIRTRKDIYLLMNKPAGVITSRSDPEGRKTAFDILPKNLKAIHSVGRLDKDTSGILLLTNDGGLTYRLTHPKFEVRKKYRVVAEGGVSDKEKRVLERGMFIDGRRTAPAKIEIVRSGAKDTELFIEIHEGRKRQIRNMFLFLGHPVKSMERVSYEFLKLGGLKRGEFRHLTGEEVKRLKAL